MNGRGDTLTRHALSPRSPRFVDPRQGRCTPAACPHDSNRRDTHRSLRMMAVIALSMLPGMTVPTPAAIMLAEFHQSYWVADGVAIGRVVGEQGPTIEIQVEEWIRDRTEQHQGQIRSLPYSEPSCLPGSGRVDS